MKNYAIRHGEVLLFPIDKLPKGKKTKFKSFIVGHSETGHHHVLESGIDFDVIEPEKSNLDKGVFLSLVSNAKLVHKKQVDAHRTLTVPKGKYKVVYKKEYNPWTKTIGRVFD